MGANEYAGDVALLLADEDDSVQVAAIEALAAMDAKQHARDIAALLNHMGDPSVYETACYALAKLRATEHAPDIARLLDERFQKGDAAKALAIMGANQYVQRIAGLLNDSECLVRKDALVALGILDAKEYARDIAGHLEDEQEFVRQYAAVALLLLNAGDYAEQIVALLDPSGTGEMKAGLTVSLFDLVVVEDVTSICDRAQKAFEQMVKIKGGLEE